MRKSVLAFGKTAFTKPGYHVINKPLFTSWAVTLAYSDYPEEVLRRGSNVLVEKLSSAIKKDSDYFNAITTSTATNRSIEKQFSTAYGILEEMKNADQA